jgi:signal peptidase II
MGSLDGNALLFIVMGLVVVFDQVTKVLVTSRLAEGRVYSVAGSLGLVRSTSQGATFLALSARRAILVWVAVLVCLELMLSLGITLSAVGVTGLGLSLGGAIGNLVDRVTRGGVVDFIALPRWPTFNLADGAMVCGIAVAAFSLL